MGGVGGGENVDFEDGRGRGVEGKDEMRVGILV